MRDGTNAADVVRWSDARNSHDIDSAIIRRNFGVGWIKNAPLLKSFAATKRAGHIANASTLLSPSCFAREFATRQIRPHRLI
jgi:hypothetical protein